MLRSVEAPGTVFWDRDRLTALRAALAAGTADAETRSAATELRPLAAVSCKSGENRCATSDLLNHRFRVSCPAQVRPPYEQAVRSAAAELQKRAQKLLTLPAGMRDLGPGPWSVADDASTPPSGDRRDYMTTSPRFFASSSDFSLDFSILADADFKSFHAFLSFGN